MEDEMIDPWLSAYILEMARRCGDCRRLFDNVEGAYVYARMYPARLICHDCKLKEPPRTPEAKS